MDSCRTSLATQKIARGLKYMAKKAEVIKTREKKNGDLEVTIPPAILKKLGWKEGDTVDIYHKDGKVYIKKV